MQKYQNNATTLRGDAIKGASITVTTLAGDLATLYSDNGVTVQANPIITGRDGEYSFYAADGRYNIGISAPGFDGDAVSDFLIVDSLALAGDTAGNAALTAADREQTGLDRIEVTLQASNANASALASEVSRLASGVSAGLAAMAKTAAEAARDASFVTGPKFASEAEGRAAVADGVTFFTQPAGLIGVREYTRTNSGSSALVATYASSVTSAVTLLGSEAQGFALDATTDLVQQAVKVLDTTTPANNYQGTLLDFLPATCFPQPKMVVLQDGSMSHVPHNILRYSEDIPQWTKQNMTVGAVDGEGFSSLANTSNSASYIHSGNGVTTADFVLSANYTFGAIVKKGTSPWMYVDFRGTSGVAALAYFDLTNGVVGTVAAGLTANIYTTNFDGSALPAGQFRLVVKRNATTTGILALMAPTDADAAVFCTVGRTVFVKRAKLHMGLKELEYVKTVATKVIGIPYDWSRGTRALLTEQQTSTFYSLHSEDLTQAAWVKVNGTPALDRTGPFGEPCSSFTATAANATCLQSVTTTATTAYAQFRIKRLTGTGTVSITADNGATWKDVTASINSAGFALAYCRATTTNPTFGIRLGTSGDSVAVSLAEIGSICSSPLPIYAAARTRTLDAFVIALSKLPAFTSASMYVDFTLASEYELIGTGAGSIGLWGTNGATDDYHLIGRATNTAVLGRFSRLSTVTKGQTFAADAPANLHVEGALCIAPTGVTHSINGLGEVYDSTSTVGTLVNLKVTGSEPVYVRRILMIPRALADDGLAKWKYSGDNADARYVADVKVEKFGGIAGASNVREPVVEVISDSSTRAVIAVGFMNRNNNNGTGNVEMPARAMWRTFAFDKQTQALTPLTASSVLAEQASWSGGLGHIQGAKLIKIKHGDMKGRLLLIYTQLDSANGMLSPTDFRRVYCKYSDDNGLTWSVPAVIVEDPAMVLLYVTCGGDYVQYASGPYAGRIVLPVYGAGTSMVIFSDNYGANWTKSNSIGLGDEASLSLRPDGKTLVLVTRQGDYSTSTDYGVTLAAKATVPGYTPIAVSSSLLENDPQGAKGRLGELLLVGARSNTPVRSMLTVEQLTGPTLAPSGSQFLPLGRWRATGYVSAQRLSEGFAAIAYESSLVANANTQCDIRLMIVRLA